MRLFGYERSHRIFLTSWGVDYLLVVIDPACCTANMNTCCSVSALTFSVCICLRCLSGECDVLELCIGKCLSQALMVPSRAVLCKMLLTGHTQLHFYNLVFNHSTCQGASFIKSLIGRTISILELYFQF